MSKVSNISEKINQSIYIKPKIKRPTLIKFLLIVSIIVAYFLWMSAQYGLDQGLLITLLTWSFFVFCTPIADAGFLLDFPLRVLTGIRMLYSEVLVWIIAAIINMYSLSFNSQIYETMTILTLFKKILTTPIPYWSIIILSAMGTFLSVYLGDELVDAASHKNKKDYIIHNWKHLILMVGFVITIVFLYQMLLQEAHIQI